jgi:hypothetical protein
MSPDYWHKQTRSKPLYPELSWSRPENKLYAGKLLVVGGNAQGFASAAQAYSEAQRAGAGVVRVLLPDVLAKTLGKTFEAGEFAPSTPSGSFGQRALAEMLSLAQWADAVLVDGDLGKNSETAILMEKFVSKFRGPLALSSDAIDFFLAVPEPVLLRPNTLLIVDFNQLQKLFSSAHFPRAVTSDMGALRFAEALHYFSLQHHAHIVTRHSDYTFVAVEGQVSSTPVDSPGDWQTKAAAHASVWWLQNPGKPFAALTTSLASD